MPTSLIGCLVAVALGGFVAMLTPALLRWCPVPPDEPDVPPFSELATSGFRWTVFVVAALAGSVALGLTAPAFWLAWIPLATVGALLALVDQHTTFLPLRLNYLALGVAVGGAVLAAWWSGDGNLLLWSLGGGLGATALFWVLWRVTGLMGFGDVRLAGLIGVVAGTGGLAQLVWAFLLGSVAGAVWGIVVRVRRGADGEFPYGPALLLGPFLALLMQFFQHAR